MQHEQHTLDQRCPEELLMQDFSSFWESYLKNKKEVK